MRLQIDNQYEILQAEIVYQKKPNNFSFSVNHDGKSILINFDYFHTREGVILNLYHTGTSNTDISILGTIKGAKSISRGVVEKNDVLFSFFDNTFGRVLPPRKEGNPLYKIIFVSLFVILLPLIVIVTMFEEFMRVYRRAPKEYKLDDSD